MNIKTGSTVECRASTCFLLGLVWNRSVVLGNQTSYISDRGTLHEVKLSLLATCFVLWILCEGNKLIHYFLLFPFHLFVSQCQKLSYFEIWTLHVPTGSGTSLKPTFEACAQPPFLASPGDQCHRHSH